MKKITVINILIITLFVIGILGTGILVINEFNTGEGCPKFGYIPACYIIFACFVIPFLAHLLKKWNFIYFLGTGLAFIIAVIASIMQFNGNAECPKTSNGIPMCYYSFLIFSSLILLKVLYIKYKNIRT